jgi:hypothetical protein
LSVGDGQPRQPGLPRTRLRRLGCAVQNHGRQSQIRGSAAPGRRRAGVQSALFDFARHDGFAIEACNVARGNEKGRVESGVGYAKKNFLHGLEAMDATITAYLLAPQYLEALETTSPAPEIENSITGGSS